MKCCTKRVVPNIRKRKCSSLIQKPIKKSNDILIKIEDHPA